MIRNLLQKNNSLILVVSAVALSVAMTACGKKDAGAPEPRAAAAPAPKTADKPVQKQASSSAKLPVAAGNQFDFSNKKDPFKPYMNVKAAVAPTADQAKRARLEGLPIHRYDVGQFRVIGIVTGAKDNQAMVVDPTGKGYVLKSGMLIGKNEGRISAITANGIEVVEQFKDDNGKNRKEVIKLTLPRKQ